MIKQPFSAKASDDRAAVAREIGFVLAKTRRPFTPPIVTLAMTADAS
jgi:hypothetical protein